MREYHAAVWVTVSAAILPTSAFLRIRLIGQKLVPFLFPAVELKKICCA